MERRSSFDDFNEKENVSSQVVKDPLSHGSHSSVLPYSKSSHVFSSKSIKDVREPLSKGNAPKWMQDLVIQEQLLRKKKNRCKRDRGCGSVASGHSSTLRYSNYSRDLTDIPHLRHDSLHHSLNASNVASLPTASLTDPCFTGGQLSDEPHPSDHLLTSALYDSTPFQHGERRNVPLDVYVDHNLNTVGSLDVNTSHNPRSPQKTASDKQSMTFSHPQVEPPMWNPSGSNSFLFSSHGAPLVNTDNALHDTSYLRHSSLTSEKSIQGDASIYPYFPAYKTNPPLGFTDPQEPCISHCRTDTSSYHMEKKKAKQLDEEEDKKNKQLIDDNLGIEHELRTMDAGGRRWSPTTGDIWDQDDVESSRKLMTEKIDTLVQSVKEVDEHQSYDVLDQDITNVLQQHKNLCEKMDTFEKQSSELMESLVAHLLHYREENYNDQRKMREHIQVCLQAIESELKDKSLEETIKTILTDVNAEIEDKVQRVKERCAQLKTEDLDEKGYTSVTSQELCVNSRSYREQAQIRHFRLQEEIKALVQHIKKDNAGSRFPRVEEQHMLAAVYHQERLRTPPAEIADGKCAQFMLQSDTPSVRSPLYEEGGESKSRLTLELDLTCSPSPCLTGHHHEHDRLMSQSPRDVQCETQDAIVEEQSYAPEESTPPRELMRTLSRLSHTFPPCVSETESQTKPRYEVDEAFHGERVQDNSSLPSSNARRVLCHEDSEIVVQLRDQRGSCVVDMDTLSKVSLQSEHDDIPSRYASPSLCLRRSASGQVSEHVFHTTNPTGRSVQSNLCLAEERSCDIQEKPKEDDHNDEKEDQEYHQANSIQNEENDEQQDKETHQTLQEKSDDATNYPVGTEEAHYCETSTIVPTAPPCLTKSAAQLFQDVEDEFDSLFLNC